MTTILIFTSVTLILLTGSAQGIKQATELCSERSMIILDAKISKFVPVGNNPKLPENKEQGKKFCK